MNAAVVLVIAKAPVPGYAKTRLARTVGNDAAAEVAAAAFLDTLEVCEQVFPPGRRYVALSGDLDAAHGSSVLQQRILSWTVIPQRGDGLAARIANAHRDAHRHAGAPVVQIGMDTPHLDGAVLAEVAEKVAATGRPVLGLAEDGGWWLLATSRAADVEGLYSVPMSTSTTGEDTMAMLGSGRVHHAPVMRDVDDADDADGVAPEVPQSHFGRAWLRLAATSTSNRSPVTDPGADSRAALTESYERPRVTPGPTDALR